MSTSDRWVRDKDRDAAIELVEAAAAAGRIVEADRDKRVAELRRAETMAEVYLLTRDLAREDPTYLAPPPATVEYGPPQAGVAQRSGKPSKALFVIPLVVVLVVGIAVVGLIAAVSGVVDQVSDVAGGLDQDDAAEVLSSDGYADLLSAVEGQSGGTVAFDAVLYPEYAVVSLPVDEHSQRYKSWYWDGSTLAQSSQGTASGTRFDLAGVDADVVVDVLDEASQRVEEPTSTYAILRAPDADGAVVWAYASNAYSETAYLAARPDGTITFDSTQR